MVHRRDILELAGQLGLSPQVVEKDYVLGWLLAGISSRPELAENWVFKGGTCLKKCYFETYRFSEDLDFTLSRDARLDEAYLREQFESVAEWIYETAGIEIPVQQLRFQPYENHRGGACCQGRVYYRGPIAPRGDLPRIKLDLTADEIVVLPSENRRVAHPYADEPPDGIHVSAYSFEEVFAEKIRALAERGRPRDLYDVVNLFRNDAFSASGDAIPDVLRRKCEFKGIALPTLVQLAGYRPELQADWESMLAHQLPSLPPFDAFWGALPSIFEWLDSGRLPEVPAPLPLASDQEIVYLPATTGAVDHRGREPLDIVRFAAFNHLCVDLDYNGTTRRIEPYSLRRTHSGNLLLYALHAESDETRSYRVDRIEGAHATDQSFTPRYTVELAPGGAITAPPTASRGSLGGRRSRGTSRPRRGPVYIYECGICGKRFKRSRRNSVLRPHKSPDGWPCSGRRATLVDIAH